MTLQFHPHHHKPPLPQPRRQTSDQVIDQLKVAVSANDVNAFHKQLVGLLPSSPRGPFNIHDLCPVMYEAVRRDCAAVVEEPSRYGMDVRYTFAVEAIHAKAKGSLDVFLKHRWDVNAPTSETEPTAFAYAVADRDMALYLLGRGADLNRPTTYIDLTPMSYAVELASPDLVEELLDCGGDVHKGELLQHALYRPADVVKILGMLLDRGAPLNATMYANHETSRRLYPFMALGTLLHKAATMGNADAVRYLLERNADVTIRDTKGRTAIECAERDGHDEVVGILAPHRAL